MIQADIHQHPPFLDCERRCRRPWRHHLLGWVFDTLSKEALSLTHNTPKCSVHLPRGLLAHSELALEHRHPPPKGEELYTRSPTKASLNFFSKTKARLCHKTTRDQILFFEKYQSVNSIPGVFTRSSAACWVAGGGIITFSPGCQLAGHATP